jgi:hypothetical protein
MVALAFLPAAAAAAVELGCFHCLPRLLPLLLLLLLRVPQLLLWVLLSRPLPLQLRFVCCTAEQPMPVPDRSAGPRRLCLSCDLIPLASCPGE